MDAPTHRTATTRMAIVVGWCERVRECVCVRAHVCVRECVRACVPDVFAIYDNNTLPRLIMIIIKIIFLYFVEIALTGDFPSTGTRLVFIMNGTVNYNYQRNGVNIEIGCGPMCSLNLKERFIGLQSCIVFLSTCRRIQFVWLSRAARRVAVSSGK